MKNLTEKELAQVLLETTIIKGMPLFASVLQETEPKCTKKSRVTGEKNPFEKILKRSFVSIILNTEYEKAVTNQLERENKDTSEYKKGINTMPLVFGENNQFIGIYNGEFVLQYRPNNQIKPKSTYFADSVETEKDKLTQYLPVENHATNQGTDKEIFWRKLYLKNVLELTLNGETYKLIR